MKAIELDALTPSIIATSFQWGSLRRQVMFLIISQMSTTLDPSEFLSRCGGSDAESTIDPIARLGSSLLTQRPQHLLRELLSTVPDGLIGTLRRLGPEPAENPLFYTTLLRVFNSPQPANRIRVRLLGQSTGPLRPGQIEGLAVLDPAMLHLSVLARTKNVAEAQTLNNALAYVRARCRTATDQALRQSLDRISEQRKISHWFRRWAERFDRLPVCVSPFVADPTLRVLDSGPALLDAGRRYGNCLASKIGEVVTGRYLFIEHQPDPSLPGAIAELRYTSKGYVLDGLYMKSNGALPHERAAALRTRLAKCGVAIRCHVPGDEAQLKATAKLLGVYDWRGHGGDMPWGLDLEEEFEG